MSITAFYRHSDDLSTWRWIPWHFRNLFVDRQWSPSPYINHFISADTIVPNPADPQSLNRYSYVTNNPLRYTDPTGHMLDDGCNTEGCNLTSQQKAIDAQKQATHEAEAAKRKCEKGNKAYCSGWPSSKKVKRLLDPRPFINDAWDGLTNPMSGVGFGYFVPSICQASGQSCNELTEQLVDVGSDIVINIITVGSNIKMVPDMGPTPTPYMISPTPSTPAPTPTSSLSTPTITAATTPTLTVTPTLTITPSATLVVPTWTSTSIFTPAYRAP